MIWGSTLAASFAIFTLSDLDLLQFAMSIILVASMLIVYVALIPRSIADNRFLPLVKAEADIAPLSSRIIVMLVLVLILETIVFGFPSIGIIHTLLLGFMKAFSWYFMIRLVCCPFCLQEFSESAD